MLVVVGVVALFVMHQQMSPPRPRMYGPEPHVSARVAVDETSKPVSETVGENVSGDNDSNTTDRVPNPRKASSDLVEATTTKDVRVPATHIVGFNLRQSNDSRSRLLARQREEMKGYALHQYE